MNIGQGRLEPHEPSFESPMEVILSAPSFDATPTVIRFTEQVQPPPLFKDMLTSHTPSPAAQREPEPEETDTISPYNQPFLDMLGEEILLTLDAVIIKMPHSPFQEFPTSLSFPIARIAQFVPFGTSPPAVDIPMKRTCPPSGPTLWPRSLLTPLGAVP